jgi:hypothetical protein
MEGQMTMMRQARRVGDPRDVLALVDMAGVLMDAGYPQDAVADALQFPTQGNVTRDKRLREAMDIARAWPEELLLQARLTQAAWHALREPARWWRNGDLEREDVVAYVTTYLEQHGAWPRIDDLRRHYGFAVTHDRSEPMEGQDALEIDMGEVLDDVAAQDQPGRVPCSGRG